MRTLTYSKRESDRAVVTYEKGDAFIVLSVIERPDSGEGKHFSFCLSLTGIGADLLHSDSAFENSGVFGSAGQIIDGSNLIGATENIVFVLTGEVL